MLFSQEPMSSAETIDGEIIDIVPVRQQIQQQLEKLTSEGFRTLGILVFFDPLKAGILETINRLKQLGVSLKVISGDNKLVVASVSGQIGLSIKKCSPGRNCYK
jgi:Mg2+-importing ATPase